MFSSPRHPLAATSASTPSTATPTASASTPSTTSTASTVPTPPAALAPAQPAPRTEEFGASVNLLFNSGTSTPPQIAAQLQALRATGATFARSDSLWEYSEPAAPVNGVHHFDWAFDDMVAGDLAAHRLRWLPILDYTATWARSIPDQAHSPPVSNADYAAYAGAFAARYGRGGSFWSEHPSLPAEPVQTYEIWNEPDSGQFWAPVPDAARYADLYTVARVAIDAADPSARVIVGGLTQPTVFVPALVAAAPQLRGHIDGIAIHPYGPPAVVFAKVREDRAALVALGTGIAAVPIYVTEFGWTTSPLGTQDYVSPDRRPRYIAATLAALGHTNCGVAASALYTWFSPQQNPASGEQYYGIDSLDGAPTADTRAFGLGLRRGGRPAKTILLCG